MDQLHAFSIKLNKTVRSIRRKVCSYTPPSDLSQIHITLQGEGRHVAVVLQDSPKPSVVGDCRSFPTKYTKSQRTLLSTWPL